MLSIDKDELAYEQFSDHLSLRCRVKLPVFGHLTGFSGTLLAYTSLLKEAFWIKIVSMFVFDPPLRLRFLDPKLDLHRAMNFTHMINDQRT